MTVRVCGVAGCGEEYKYGGYCKYHYERNNRLGAPGPPREFLPEGYKRCSACREVKTYEEFHRQPMGKGGREGKCKACKRLAYLEKSEQTKARQRSRYANDAELRFLRKRQRDEWNAANRERVAQVTKAWRETHPDRVRAYREFHQRKDPEATNAYARAWRAANRDKARRVARKSGSARRAAMLDQFVEHVDPAVCFESHDGICGICGELIEADAAYHIDHIIPLSRGGEHSYANSQPAHPSCNQRKYNKLDYVHKETCRG